MNNQIYHKTSKRVYIDNGDGSLTQMDYRGNVHTHPNTIAFVKNDAQGMEYIKSLKIKMNRTSFKYLFRCPKSGTYNKDANGKRITILNVGNVTKDRAMVISVR
jgi:hypothetical protein